MTKLVIRHGLSEANNKMNIGKLAFASSDAPLMPEGRIQAVDTRKYLLENYDRSIFNKTIAVSTMLRTQETAMVMGFSSHQEYDILDEVNHRTELHKLRIMLDKDILPVAALDHAEYLLEHPPEEGVWVTHGLVIAGLCKVLGISQENWRLIPRFCEVRELPIS